MINSSDIEPGMGSIDRHRIASMPPSMYYIPDFISAEEESYLLNKVRPQLP